MKPTFNNIKNIFWLYKPNWKYGKVFVLLSLFFWLALEPLSQLINVYLPNIIIDALVDGMQFNEIVKIVILLHLVLMFKPVYEDIFNMFCKNKMLPKIEMKIKRNIYERAIKTDYKFIDNPEFYDNYSWAINEYANKSEEAQDLINRISYSLITAISMLTIIATISPIAIVVIIVCGIIENAFYAATNYFDVKKDNDIIPWDRRLGYYHRVFYLREHAADLKSTNLRKHIFRDYEDAKNTKLGIIQKYAFKMIGWSMGGVLTFYIARVFIVINIVYGIYNQDIPSVGSYVTMMLAVAKLTEMANDLFYHVREANRLGLYATKIREFFKIESKIETQTEKQAEPPSGSFSVEFHDACFKYDNSEFAISNLNLKVNPGEKIAIVGANGVGKSTLVKLLLRLYDLTSGSISINGTDVKGFDLDLLRQKIGVAFQASNVYAFSLADNIQLYNDIDDEKLASIVKQLNLDKILEKNNASLSSTLTKEFDEEGIMLSGGEVQKIGIARLLAGNFGLLLLDEPSSALDPIAEYEMSKLILDSSNLSTTIIIAHRLSTIRNADRIILMENGTTTEIGTHDELMTAKGKYYEMFTKQAENYTV